MKAKEKGIPEKELRRSSEPKQKRENGPQGKFDKKDRKFNAFREMDKMKKGFAPDLAKIQDGVAVVGKPVVTAYEGLGKRGREDDGEKGKKVARTNDVSGRLFFFRRTLSLTLASAS
jgi:lupus La protein